MTGGHARRALCLATLLVGLAGSARGGDAAPRSVEVIFVGSGRDTGTLVDTVRELLGRLGLVVNVHAVSGDADAAGIERGASVARVRVDLRMPDRTVLVVDGRTGAPAQRSVKRAPSPSIAREELAQAIQGAIEAQLFVDGDRPLSPTGPTTAAPTPAPTPPPPPLEPPIPVGPGPLAVAIPPVPAPVAPKPPQPRSLLALDVTTYGGIGGYADGTGPVGVLGGEVGVAWRTRFSPSASLAVRGVLPFEGQSGAVVASGSAVSLRLYGGVELARASWIQLGVGAGGGLDVLSVSSRSSVLPESALAAPSTRADPVLSLVARVRFPLASSVAFAVDVVGDFDLYVQRYVVERGATDDVVLSPWRFRPALLAGFTFTPFGDGLFAARGGP
jgi:hypothetical protein